MPTGISDQTKKIAIGAAVATATVGAGYFLYRRLNAGPTELSKQLEQIKADGNELFKMKNYEAALKAFSKGIDLGKDKNEAQTLVAMLYQNRAACKEKTGESAFGILEDCIAALKHDRKYAKAYLRAAKQLHNVGKKHDALAHLLAAFALDDKLNKSNFDFFDKLLVLEPADCIIPEIEGIRTQRPAPVSLFRLQQWYDTWDFEDLFKYDVAKFVATDDQFEREYRKALDALKSGEYEKVLEELSEETTLVPAMILRAKFLGYSINPNQANEWIPKIESVLSSAIENTQCEERKRQLREAYDVLRLETVLTMQEMNKYLEETINEEETARKFALYTFSGILTFSGCVLDEQVSSHEAQMMADTKNTANLIEAAGRAGTLTPHAQAINMFISLCSTTEYSEVHRTIMEMEQICTQHPTHFILVLMAKVYLMTGNNESAAKLLNEADKIPTRCLVPARILQRADMYLNESQEKRLKHVSECANKVIAVDEHNFSAHILLLLGCNGSDPAIKRENFEEAMEHITNAAVLAPPRELLMLKRMMPLLNAKKRASELLGVY